MDWLNSLIVNVLPFLVVITILVYIHELGHYVVARINNVKIEAFSIGFGPEIFGWNNKHGTRWKVCVLPFGGYVKMYGENPSSKEPEEIRKKLLKDTQSLLNKSPWQRIAIAAAGPFANYALSVFLLIGIFVFDGEKKIDNKVQIGTVMKDSLAEKYGLKNDDIILKAGEGEQINVGSLISKFKEYADKPIILKILRKKETLYLTVTPSDENKLGITLKPVYKKVRHDIFTATEKACTFVYTVTIAMFKGLYQMISGESKGELAGPLGIAKITTKVLQHDGVIGVLMLMVFLSLNLGLINMLPFPVLDGGHILFCLIEIIRGGKPVSIKIQEKIFTVAATMLIGLAIIITINDFLKL